MIVQFASFVGKKWCVRSLICRIVVHVIATARGPCRRRTPSCAKWFPIFAVTFSSFAFATRHWFTTRIFSDQQFLGQNLETGQSSFTVSGIDVVRYAGSFDFRECAEWQFLQAFELLDVRFGANVFGEMTLNAKRRTAVRALEWSWIASRHRAKCRCDAHFCAMAFGTFVLL